MTNAKATWLVSFLAAACGGAPAATPAGAPPATPMAITPRKRELPVEVVNLAAARLEGIGYDDAVTFTKAGALVFRGPAGLHTLDPATGVERLLRRNADSWWSVVYRSPRWFLLRSDSPFEMTLADVEDETVRRLGVTAGTYAFSHDDTRLLWQPYEGAAVLIDPATPRAVHTFPRPRKPDDSAQLSPDDRYAYLHGNLYEITTNRVVWSSKSSHARVSFGTVSGEPVLLAAGLSTLELVELASGTSHLANVDCIDEPLRSDAHAGSWFVRTCPRGVLVTDLVQLLRAPAASGPLTEKSPRLPPTRHRGATTHRFTPADGVAIQVRADRWVLHETTGSKPRSLAPGAPEVAPRPEVLTASADGTRRVERDGATCTLVDGSTSHVLPGKCTRPALSRDGRFLASVADDALAVLRVPELTPAFESDPEHRRPAIEATFEDGLRIHVVSATDDPKAPRRDFWIEPTDGVEVGGVRDPQAAVGAAPEERSENYGDSHPLIGTVADLEIRLEGRGVAGLELWHFLAMDDHTLRLALVLGADFGIFESPSHRVQIVGNQRAARRWLRCLENDEVLRPFEACPTSLHAALY